MGERLVPGVHVATMVIVPIVASLPWMRFDVPESIRHSVCAVLVAIGVAIMGWTLLHLRGATRPRISPVSPVLVTSGPFRFVRHPFYLGIAIVLLGTVAKVASILGLAAWLLVHLTITLWRIRLEDAALEAQFPDEWRKYAGVRTGSRLER
jgi:protein-S-isoprenylcysteine O-methyltransferase Ste14